MATIYRLPIAIEHALPNWPLVDFGKYFSKKAGNPMILDDFSILSLSHGFDRDRGFVEFFSYFFQDGKSTGRVPMDA
jgi:hypothetical protein